ncbi:uncharacterized protein METZ01_LOCUS361201 [marine metagenome]|uniref:Uncharacterized protein n=1 Tax=marine metagenome TaxID=408172 RepID=A0A382SGN7_9ZZZZ
MRGSSYELAKYISSRIAIEEEMVSVDIDLDNDLYDKIVAHLETSDPNIISQWISEAIKIVITEYIEKEGGR